MDSNDHIIKVAETPPLIAMFKAVKLNLNWHVEHVRKGVGVLSGFLDCERFLYTFQLGLRYENNGVATVSLTILNLHHLWLRVPYVQLTCNEGETFLMKRSNIEKVASKLELFKHRFEKGLDSVCRFNCQVYLEGVDKSYIHQQYDQLLNDQLWTYTQLRCCTDLKFFLGEKVFNAHKFVIFTRSSRLAAEFDQNDKKDSIELSGDLNPETFKCFLYFLYTGRLMLTTVCDQLKTLADKYGVETLKTLCEADLKKITNETFPEHFMSTRPAATGMMEEPLEFDLRPKSVFSIEHDSIGISISWDIDLLPEDKVIKKVNYNHQEMFQVGFQPGYPQINGDPRKPSIFVFSKQWPEGGIDVIAVKIGIEKLSQINGKKIITEKITASKREKGAGLEPAMNIFSAEISKPLLAPFTLIILIDMSCKNVGNYSYQLRDITYADSLWSSASIHIGRFTDVEFVVDGRTFKAHKALMAARSPVFRELLNSNRMKESEGIQSVVLDDLNSDTFKQVLKFIYTGSLQVSACDPKLLIAADKYQIETLKFLCENQVRQRDRSHQDLFSYLAFS